MCTKFYSENLKGRGLSEELALGERIKLEWMLRK
jgi:hypothetical protein